MKLLLIREPAGKVCNHGKLYVNGVQECFTLEGSEHGRTAIPRGSYEVVITFSQRFKRDMPLVLDVPGFSGVRIHDGDTTEDTEGGVLVGSTRGDQCVRNCRAAFGKLFDQLDEAYAAHESITLEIA